MPPRPTDRALKGRNDIIRVGPTADASSGQVAIAKAAEQVGSAINAPLRQIARQLEIETEKEFEARGREQALAAPEETLPNGARVPKIALREGTSITSEAFNRGVLSVAPQRMQASLIEGMDTLEQQHIADPQGFNAASQVLFEQLTNAAPAQLKAAMELDFTRRRVAGMQRQNKAFVDKQVTKVRATSATTLETLGESAASAAFNTITTNPDEREVNGQIVEDAREKIGELLSQLDPLGQPIYSPEEQRKLKQSFEDNIVIQGARGGFERAVDKEKYIATWLDKRKRDGELGLDLIDRVGSELLADLRLHNALTASSRRQTNREVKEAALIFGRGQSPTGIVGLRQRLRAVDDQASLDVLDRAEKLQQDVKRFRQSPLADQQGMLQELRDKDQITIEDSDRMVAYEMNLGRAAQGLSKDPLGWARQTEVLQGAPANPTSLSVDQLQQRQTNAEIVHDQFNLPRQPYLRPGEASVMAQNFQRLTPPEAVDAASNLGTLNTASQRDIIKNLGDELPGLDIGIEMSMTAEGTEAGTLYFEGARALQEQPDMSASDVLIAEALDAAGVTETYSQSPEALASIGEATRAIAAALALRRGKITAVQKQIAEAVRLASGGIVEFNGRAIAPPLPQMAEREVGDLVERLTDQDLITYGTGEPIFKNGKRLTAEVLADDMELQSFGPGQYLVVDSASRPVMSRDGLYVLDLREAWLEGRAAVPGDDAEREIIEVE